MSLRERLLVGVVGLVAVTALAVAGVSDGWGGAAGGTAVRALVVLVVAVLGAVAAYHGLVVPFEERLQDLVNRIRMWNTDHVHRPSPEPDPDLAPLEETVFAVMAQLVSEKARLLQRSQLVTEMIQAAHVGVALLDDSGRFTEVNDAFRGMFRLRGEPLGRRPLEAVPAVEVHLTVEGARMQGTAEQAFTTESSDLVATATALTDGVFLRVEDVTGHREAQRARTDFVANVSHELRTPLTAILGFLETVLHERDRVPDDLVDMLLTVERNTRRLRDLFEDLLRLHRIEARRRELPMDAYDLRTLLEEATGPARDRAQMQGQRFELDCPEGLEAWANQDALSAIVSNLANNASIYTPNDGHVVVRATRVEQGVRIDVQDDGIGIQRVHHERIFERFYRVDAARSRRAGGTGLGLAIVKHYAMACGFQISVESEEGEGSTFSVLLPDGPPGP